MGRFTEALKAEISSYEDRKWEGKLGNSQVVLSAQPLSPADISLVRRKYPDFMQQPEPAAMVEIICQKAKDDEGNKAFVAGIDGPILKKMKVADIGEIFQALFGDDFDDETFDEKVEGAEKN